MIETDEQKSSLPAFPAVAIVVSGLGCGGAEKAAVSLANFLVEEGFPVTLMSFEKSGVEPFFSVDPRVTVLNLDLARDSRNVFLAVRNNLSRVLKIRGAIRKAKSEVVVSFMDSTNALTFFANIFSRIPVVLCERSLLKRNASGLVWRALVRISYIAVAARLKQGRIIFQSPAQLDANLTRLRHSIAFIPNAIELPAAALRKAETNVLVAVGRLAKEKRFEKLLEVFSLVRESVPETELRIVGDGPERPGLEARICELGLTGSVRLMGRMREPEVFLAGASLFINTSEYEGFPNALCEAMAAAIPPVSFHCPGAIGEIIDSGRNGVLVANDCKFAMAEAIIRLLRDESVREQLGTAARETMKSYSPAIVYGRWKEELLSVLDRRVETGTNSEGPLHICLLIRRLETGGAERQAVALANYLVNRGVRVTLMTFYPKHPGCGFHVDERVVQVCLKKRGIGDFPFFLINLRKELARMKPHVVYTFMEGANICGALSRIGSRAGFTLVWGIRSSDNRAGAYGRVRRLARLCESLLAGLPDAIFCNSAAGMRESKARAFPVRKIALVRNGVDIAAFDSRAERATVRNRFGLAPEDQVIGTVARLDPMKGLDLLLTSCQILAADFPRLRLLLVCPGEEKEFTGLLEQIRRAGLEGRCVALRQSDSIATIYQAMDLFCLPSLFGEGTPNALLEAVASGVDCIASDVGDCRLILNRDLIFESGSQAELISLIKRFLMLGLRHEMKGVRDRTLSRHDSSAAFAETLAMLKAVYRKGTGPARAALSARMQVSREALDGLN